MTIVITDQGDLVEAPDWTSGWEAVPAGRELHFTEVALLFIPEELCDVLVSMHHWRMLLCTNLSHRPVFGKPVNSWLSATTPPLSQQWANWFLTGCIQHVRPISSSPQMFCQPISVNRLSCMSINKFRTGLFQQGQFGALVLYVTIHAESWLQ